MATVRFSKELIDRIMGIAKAKMRPAVNKATEQRPDNAWGQRIYDTLFAEVKPLITQLPVGWCKEVKDITITRVGSHQCGLKFDFAAPQPWPVKLIENNLFKPSSYYGDDITLKDHLIWGEFHAEVVAYKERVNTAAQREVEFVNSVKTICTTYTTLAPALKAWPPLWDLIPEDVKDKHREIKEREKKEVLLAVDINKLTAMSVAAKFGI
jgi:hypothetical protein